MNLTISSFKKALSESHPAVLSVFAAVAAFATYSCMYAFRKPFTAATFDQLYFLGLKYKDVLVIAQLIGYTLSKFMGIKIVAEMKTRNRGFNVLMLIAMAALSLFLFGITPKPYNILFMFLNGIPLGMVWGIVFSFLEGRRTTEFMGSVMAVSFIFSSGFVKSAGKFLLNSGISEFWMPLLTGLLFFIPMLLFIFMLEQIPDPSASDIAHRSARQPMDGRERSAYVKKYLPGIIALVTAYVMLTIIRDFRDNFAADIWQELNIHDAAIFTQTEVPISLAILASMSLLILIKDNKRAFQFIHLVVVAGFVLAGGATFLFVKELLSPFWWITFTGLGLYLGYVPFNVVFFERKIAAIRHPANVGFLIYIADSFGYLGSMGIILFKNFGTADISYSVFFINSLYAVSILGIAFMLLSLLYFNRKIK